MLFNCFQTFNIYTNHRLYRSFIYNLGQKLTQYTHAEAGFKSEWFLIHNFWVLASPRYYFAYLIKTESYIKILKDTYIKILLVYSKVQCWP